MCSSRHPTAARGARIAAVLVKREALWIELRVDEIEHPADARLLIVDDVLVAHPQEANFAAATPGISRPEDR